MWHIGSAAPLIHHYPSTDIHHHLSLPVSPSLAATVQTADMVRLREISRTAAFAWSPGADKPFLVTGTRAGAVDADFSGDTKLELWDLGLDDQQQPLELQQPLASIVTDSR